MFFLFRSETTTLPANEVHPDGRTTMRKLIHEAVLHGAERSSHDAVITFSSSGQLHSLSWTELARWSGLVADHLRSAAKLLNLGREPRLALFCSNSGIFIATALGASIAGWVLVPINLQWSGREVDTP